MLWAGLGDHRRDNRFFGHERFARTNAHRESEGNTGARLLHKLVNVKVMLRSAGFRPIRPARAVLGATLIVSLLTLATAGTAGARTVLVWGFYTLPRPRRSPLPLSGRS